MPTNATNTTGAVKPANAWDKKELGVLWKRVKQGTTESYLTGTLNLKSLGYDKDVPVIIFSNKRKEKDTHPDLKIYLSERQAKPANAPVAPVAAAPAVPQSQLI